MLFLSKEDFYEVYLKSMISDFDRDTLSTLYQPIIGADAVSLYLTLYAEFKKNKKVNNFSQHEDLVINTGFDVEQIRKARLKLEGIGLIRTYYSKDKEFGFYKYLLFAPKTPNEFFDDILFKGLLIEKIGEKKVQDLIRKYKEKPLALDGFNEVSASFKEIFKPDYDSDYFKSQDRISGFERRVIDISKGFDTSLFLKTLESNYNIITKNISKKDLETVSGLSLLYGISEIHFADIFSQCYMNKKVDFNRIKELAIKEKDFIGIRGNNYSQNIAYDTSSKLGKKIEMMSSIAPLEYLSIKQKGAVVSPSDAKLIQDLYNKYQLTPAVINCLLDYSIERTSSLSYNYVTKIAASIAREKIDNVTECMSYLKRSNKTFKKFFESSSQDISSTNKNETKEEKLSDAELDELLSGL